MHVELIAPCCLQLGFVRASDGAMCELGIALQHPPIQLVARPALKLSVSGPRADLAYRQAETYASKNNLPRRGEIEIELAIPAFMGLGSDQMMRASVEHALSETLKVSETFRVLNLYDWAFDKGGLLLVNDKGELVRRAAISHTDEDADWVFVLVLPKTPDDISDDFETQRAAALRASAQRSTGSRDIESLFTAVERDDFDSFIKTLAMIHAANEAALAASGHALPFTNEDRDILDFMHDNGAAMCGRALTGLGLYGLIRSGRPSRELRAALTQHLGYFGPLVMASICDNHGASTNVNE